MAITALTLYVLWASLAFGWRSIDQRRRTGDSGLRLQAQPNTPQWWAKIGFAVAMPIGIAAPITAVAGLDNIPTLDAEWLHIAGIALTRHRHPAHRRGAALDGRFWRDVDPDERTELVDGAFRLARDRSSAPRSSPRPVRLQTLIVVPVTDPWAQRFTLASSVRPDVLHHHHRGCHRRRLGSVISIQGTGSGFIGNVAVIVVPTMESTSSTVPPCAFTSWETTARPMPLPATGRVESLR